MITTREMWEDSIGNYDFEAKQHFGKTDAYKEYELKTANYGDDKCKQVKDGLMTVFAKFSECKKRGHAVDSDEAQALVKELQDYITKNFYTCTNEIIAGLGQMYVADERFKENIDKCGEGTADFVAEAIATYVKGIKNV